MSTSLLYHSQSVRGVQYLRTEYSGGRITYYARVSESRIRCSNCGSWSVVRSGGVWRTFHLLPTGDRVNLLRLFIPRVKCHDCGKVRQVELLFADPRRSYSRALGRFVMRLAALMPLTRVAELCGIGWDMVKQIHKEGLRKRFRHIRLKDVRDIAIDEVCIGRPRRFLTIVMDLESGEILHIGVARAGGVWRDSGSACASAGRRYRQSARIWHRGTCPG
jgi:transposase